MGSGTLSSLSKCKNCMMASSMRGPECPSARTRRGRPGPRQVEAAGKLRSASTILSPAPRLASSCSSEGDTIEGMEWSNVSLKYFKLCYLNFNTRLYKAYNSEQVRPNGYCLENLKSTHPRLRKEYITIRNFNVM